MFDRAHVSWHFSRKPTFFMGLMKSLAELEITSAGNHASGARLMAQLMP